jgi:hypothetical protein
MQWPFERISDQKLDNMIKHNSSYHYKLKNYIGKLHPYIDTLEGTENIFAKIYPALFAHKLTFLPFFSLHFPSFSPSIDLPTAEIASLRQQVDATHLSTSASH